MLPLSFGAEEEVLEEALDEDIMDLEEDFGEEVSTQIHTIHHHHIIEKYTLNRV